jgi:hypothetical protein
VTDPRRRRAAAQRLHRPQDDVARDPAALVGALLAVQAQDYRAARLALRARSPTLNAADVDAGLACGALTITWLMRGTLHLVATEDAGWLLALTAPTRAATNARRLAQEGVAPAQAEQALSIVAEALAAGAPLSRAQLAARIAAAGIRTEGQATPHLLMLAALRGLAVLGPVDPDRGAPQFVAGPPRLDRAPALDRAGALVRLAERYLAAHAPATAEDLAAWSGLPLRDARAGLAAATVEQRDARPALAPRLLGALDPYMLGWKDRTFAVDPEHARRVHPGGGMLRPVAVHDGRVVATWKRGRRPGTVVLEPFAPLAARTERALRDDAEDVARFESGGAS